MDSYKIYPKQFRNVKIPIESNSCFFIMPFNENFDIIYGSIKQGLSEQYLCRRVDEITGSTPIINKILIEILKSQFIIVDLSESNPNVFYELGIAHTFKDAENIFLIKDKNSKAPFDITHLTYIEYDKNNLKLLVSQLKSAISDNKQLSNFYEALNIKGIIDFNHENQDVNIDIIKDILEYDYQTTTELLNDVCELNDIELQRYVLNISNRTKSVINKSNFQTTEIITNFYFVLLLSLCKITNIDIYIQSVLNEYFSNSNLSDSEIISLKTDCAVLFAKNNLKLNIVMPWIVNYFKQSRFANVDLNRYKLESFLLTTSNQNINKIICDAMFDKDSHIREHFANIIGEKRLTNAYESLIVQLLAEENYYTAGSIIEALGRLRNPNAIQYILNWINENKTEIINTNNYFVFKHTYYSLLMLNKQIAKQFHDSFEQYL